MPECYFLPLKKIIAKGIPITITPAKKPSMAPHQRLCLLLPRLRIRPAVPPICGTARIGLGLDPLRHTLGKSAHRMRQGDSRKMYIAQLLPLFFPSGPNEAFSGIGSGVSGPLSIPFISQPRRFCCNGEELGRMTTGPTTSGIVRTVRTAGYAAPQTRVKHSFAPASTTPPSTPRKPFPGQPPVIPA